MLQFYWNKSFQQDQFEEIFFQIFGNYYDSKYFNLFFNIAKYIIHE